MDRDEFVEEIAQILIDEMSMDLFDIVVQGLDTWSTADLQNLADEYSLVLSVDNA
tara:strand:- start:158 stop:322 length:165 start_codon:yes stop_codon:yes gene_type:complete